MPNSKPSDWPQISSALAVDDAAAEIDFLCRAFGFQLQLKVEGEGGRIAHSQLTYGSGLVMVGSPKPDAPQRQSPNANHGVNTQAMLVFVEDVDAHCAHARAHGAKILKEPTTTDYGEDYWADRSYEAVDPEGHHWWFSQRVRDPK